MSVDAQAWVWKHSQLRGSARLVLLRIADQANSDGSDSWPGLDLLADDCCITRRAVQKCIRKAEEAGELLVFVQAGGNDNCPADRRPNRYDLPRVDGWMPPPHIQPRVDPLEHMGKTGNGVNQSSPREQQNDGSGVNASSPREGQRDEPQFTPRGELQGTDGVNPSSPYPSLIPPTTPPARAREGGKYQDYEIPDIVRQRIRMSHPAIPEDFIDAQLPEFLTYAETHYRRDQLDSKFQANVNRNWMRSKSASDGLPRDLKELEAFCRRKGGPAPSPGESPRDYRVRAGAWYDNRHEQEPRDSVAAVNGADAWFKSWPGVLEKAAELGINQRDHEEPADLIGAVIGKLKAADQVPPEHLVRWHEHLQERAE